MSGFEVVGVVLDGIPLIIAVLEDWKKVAEMGRTWRGYRNELQTLVEELGTEQDLYKTTCEKLLTGIVSQKELHDIMTNPKSHLWKQDRVESKLRQTLWYSYDSFNNTVRDMSLVVEEFKSRLGGTTDGKLDCRTPESSRPGDDYVESLKFRLALFNTNPPSRGNGWIWDEVVVCIASKTSTVVPDKTQDVKHPKLQKRQKLKKKVRFAGASAVLASIFAPAPGSPAADTTTSVTHDLCSIITQNQNKLPACKSYGHLVDSNTSSSDSFEVSPVEFQPGCRTWTMVSLHEILQDKGNHFPKLTFRHKTKLAVLIASSMMQLHKSPWVPGHLTSRDILFIRGDDTMYDATYTSRMLAPRGQALTTPHPDTPNSDIESADLFALGVLLLELALATPLDVLRSQMQQQQQQQAHRSERKIVLEHLNDVGDEFGPNYAAI
ncbi:Uu.00g026430.m01.CDS01, partial [Anthostomella pinea]